METTIIRQNFPEFSKEQIEKLGKLATIFRDWNSRINLVSRKDIDALELHHLVHSLALAKFVEIPDRARVLDVGTGGGLPGLPLAIVYPRVRFFLCDSVAKKAAAVEEMAKLLELHNVTVVHKRAEELESQWDFILGRAVTSLPKFFQWIQDNIRSGGSKEFPNGVLYWKGSLYREELESIGLEPFTVYPIEEKIADPYFENKYIVHLDREAVRAVKCEM